MEPNEAWFVSWHWDEQMRYVPQIVKLTNLSRTAAMDSKSSEP